MKILAVDSNSILNRAFYGIRLLSTKNGVFTNAVYGFMNILLKTIEDMNPDGIVFAFDVKAPTFRHKEFAEYKAGRKTTPPEFIGQIPLTKRLLNEMKYTVIEAPGYEADDILGTISKRFSEQGHEIIILSGDRDTFQLINDKVTILLAGNKAGKTQYELYDCAKIMEKFHVKPQQLIDVKAIMGDSSDNIPGVFGIGEKGAVSLIEKFGNLDSVYENLESNEIKPSTREKLSRDRLSAQLSRKLATINCDVPLFLDVDTILFKNYDKLVLANSLKELEMLSLIKRLNLFEYLNNAESTQDDRVDAQELSNKTIDFTSVDNFDELLSVIDKQLEVLISFIENDDNISIAVISNNKGFVLCECSVNELRAILQSNDVSKVVFDSKKMFKYSLKNKIEVKNVIFDIQLAAYLADPLKNVYEVEKLQESYGEKINIFWNNKTETVSFSSEYEFNKSDVEKESQNVVDATDTSTMKLISYISNLWGIYTNLSLEIKENQQIKLLRDIEIPLAYVLAEMEHTGFLIDREGIVKFGQSMDKDILVLENEIYSLANCKFNINSTKQLNEILFNKLQLTPTKKNKSGYSTNAEELERILSEHLIIPKILEYRQLTKLKTTYVNGLLMALGANERIHSTFNQLETRTGRISSSEPNLQNIPIRTKLGRELRKFFIARDGYVLCDADYSQIELRILAALSNDINMINAFDNNEDIHSRTAAQIFGIPIDEVTAEMRTNAKAVNFGIVYGIGAFSLAKDIKISVASAKKYISEYLQNFSGVASFMEDIKDFARKNGFVKTICNRIRPISEITSRNKNVQAFGERAAMNAPIQGGAADIIKLAMIRVSTRLKKESLNARLILQVHDELIVEAPISEQKRVESILKEEMENAVSLGVDLKVDVGSGKRWFDAH